MTDPTEQPSAPCGPHTLPPRGPRTWVMVLMGLVIVASGAVIGAGVTVMVLRSVAWAPPPPPGKQTAARITADFKDRYGLDQAQADRVQEIMTRRLAAIEAIRDDAHARTQAEHEGLRSEMKAVLSPQQFENWEAKFEALRPPAFPPPPGPRGGPPGQGRPGEGRPMPPAPGPGQRGFSPPDGPPPSRGGPPPGPPPGMEGGPRQQP